MDVRQLLARLPIGKAFEKVSRKRRDTVMEALESRLMFSLTPTGLEQEMLELINRMRMNPGDELDQIFLSTDNNDPDYFTTGDADVDGALSFFGVDDTTLLNQWSSLSPVSPLAWNEALYDAATAHSDRMILQNLQAHVLPADSSLGLLQEEGLLDRAVNAGYNWSGSVSVGENVFAYGESVFHTHAAFAIDWGNTPTGIQSPPGHRDNFMDANFQEIGISAIEHAKTSSTSVGNLVVTQDFGRRGNYGDGKVLGVAFDDADGDSFYDAGEGAGGITITVENSTATYTTTTMDAGGFQVAVAAGTYTVTASGGPLATAVVMGTITVATTNEKIDLNLNDLPDTGSIAGVVFSDADEDGIQGGGEGGLAGFTVFVDTDSDGQFDGGELSTVTGADGSYLLTDVFAGTHSIAVSSSDTTYRATLVSSQNVTVTPGGTSSDVDFGQYQWIVASGNAVDVFGTSGNDLFVWSHSTANSLIANGQSLNLSTAPTTIRLHGAEGVDSVQVTGSTGTDTASLGPNSITFTTSTVTIIGSLMEDIDVFSGGGTDSAFFVDSVDDDVFTNSGNTVTLRGLQHEYTTSVHAFRNVVATATQGGTDTAYLYDTSGTDTFVGRHDIGTMRGTGYEYKAKQFESVFGYSSAGTDFAYLFDSEGNDTFIRNPDVTTLRGTGFENRAYGFTMLNAYATDGGTDNAFFYDSETSDDIFVSRENITLMRADGKESRAHQFDTVNAYAGGGGFDTATMYDTTGFDTFVSQPDLNVLSGTGYEYRVHDFSFVVAISEESTADTATFYDSAGDDTFVSRPEHEILKGTGFENRASGFLVVDAYSTSGGNDIAYLYDSVNDDTFVGRPDEGRMQRGSFTRRAHFFDTVNAYSEAGGTDNAYLYDSSGDDTFVGRPDIATMRGTGFENRALGFDTVNAYTNEGGNDIANLHDSVGNDTFVGRPEISSLRGTGFENRAHGFGTVRAYSAAGGSDDAWLYDSAGDDAFVGSGGLGILSGSSFYNYASGFSHLRLYGEEGGVNTLDLSSLDYVFDYYGNWV